LRDFAPYQETGELDSAAHPCRAVAQSGCRALSNAGTIVAAPFTFTLETGCCEQSFEIAKADDLSWIGEQACKEFGRLGHG
jgi:hypothetical protein